MEDLKKKRFNKLVAQKPLLKAATERHADGDIMKSIEINKGRFELSEQLCNIMRNTALRLGYCK